jgi:hypothetical protein
MDELTLELDEPTREVFHEIRQQKAMPFLEIAALTGVGGAQLKEAVDKLASKNLVTVSKPNDLFSSIISISGKYL